MGTDTVCIGYPLPLAWLSVMSPACPEISRLIPECPALSIMARNGPQEPRKTKSRTHMHLGRYRFSRPPHGVHIVNTLPPCIQVLRLRCTFPDHSPQQGFLFRQALRLLPAAQAVLWPLTTTFLTLSWAWLFLRPTLPFWPPPISCGTPLAFLCPRPCGQSAMQAAPAIAVQVFPFAWRPGPDPGASCLARQGTRWRQRGLAFVLCRTPDTGPQIINASCFRLASYRLAVHLAPFFFEVNTVDLSLTSGPGRLHACRMLWASSRLSSSPCPA